jgi:hypothetical protein
VRRASSTALYVLGYALMSALDTHVALLPAIASFSAANALLVRL